MMNWNWPDNKRIALLLSFDIDAETLWLTRNDINERHLVHMSRCLYATKQGLPRILKMLEEEGYKNIELIQDLSGRDRIIKARK